MIFQLKQKYNLFLTSISIIVAVYLAFMAFSNQMMEKLYMEWIYYILVANIAFWLFSLLRTRTKIFVEDLKDYWKIHKLAVIVAFVLIASGAIISKPDFRILADETNLLSMSQALYENRECKNYTSVLYYYYGFKNVISSELDKRPALFPLTVSFIHSFFGYRPENSFIVNIVSAFLSLLFLYHLVNYRFGKFWGICAMLLLASYPVFILYYTSGGFEVLNLLFSLILFWLLFKFLREPTAINTEALLLFLPLISQTRYESSFAVICILPAIFILLPKDEYFKFSYKLVLTPLFFVPVVWLRLLTDNIKGLQAQDKGKAFGFDFFKDNLEKAYYFFVGKDISYGAVRIITFFAIAGLAWSIIDFIVDLIKNQKKVVIKNLNDNKTQIIFVSSITLFYLFHAIIRFAYWGGDLALRSSSRLAIIFLPLFVYFAIKFCYGLWKKFSVRKEYVFICALIILFAYYPVAGQNLGVRDLTLYREFKATREFLDRYFPNKNEYILVVNRANMYVPLKYNSIGFDILNNKLDFVKSNLRNRTYNYLVIAQIVNKNTNIPIDKYFVPSSVHLETIRETQISADKYIRFSRAFFKNSGQTH